MGEAHTIGEVLERLKGEFDDITISKIRFLEAEGLITPDRSESGYRQFAAADLDRLRYVLRAQRDRYLPLKVIREELDRIDAGLSVGGQPPTPAADDVAAVAPDDDHDPSATGEALNIVELAEASGLDTSTLEDLRGHRLLSGGDTFDGDDLQAARLARRLMEVGLEARHLRIYRQSADREVDRIGQLVTPLLRQRNPDSRRAAAEQAERLAGDGAALHRVLLARQLRDLLSG